MVSNNLSNEFINHLFRIPFIEGGRDEKVGVDCWGLVRFCYKQLLDIEIEAYNETAYKSMSNIDITAEGVEHIKQTSPFIEVDDPQFGDIALISMLNRPIHVGFIINNSEMIHISKSAGVVFENFRGMKWQRRLQGYYRHT